MRRTEAMAVLRANRAGLRAEFGIKSLALFGSVARDQGRPDSDVDLLVEFDRPIGLLHLVGTAQHLEKLLGVAKVDLVLRRAVLPELQEPIFAEAVNVFDAPSLEIAHPAHA